MHFVSTIITLPGIGGSGETHWQTLWEKADPSMVRFCPSDWDRPELNDWIAALDRAIEKSADPPLLVAHSLACLLVAHWAVRRPHQAIRGAFLAAVPDPDGAAFPAVEAASFRAVPKTALPFPALIVASSDDPYGTIRYTRNLAKAWGAGFVAVGAHGHINSASGLGDWPIGAMLLEAFKAGLARR
jgi:uncharacterized protein